MDCTNLKIAIVSPSCPPSGSGGISSAHYNLFKALSKEKGFSVKIFTFADSRRDTFQLVEDGIERFSTPYILLCIIRYFFKIFQWLVIPISAYQIKDIMISQYGSYKAARKLKYFEPDIIIVPDHGCPLLQIKKTIKSKVILISHHNPIRFINEPLIGLHSRKDAIWANKIENYTLKKVDAVICPSHYMKNIFFDTYQYTGLVDVIPNFIDENVIRNIRPENLHTSINLPNSVFIIYIPSAGSIYKGSQYVCEIIRKIALRMKNVMIGFYLSGVIDDSMRREFTFLSRNVTIFAPGHVSYEKNISYVKSCAFCISPTLIENFGMAILEATFVGLPVITFDVGGNADIIRDGINGFLVDFMDIESLVNKSIELLTNEKLNEKMRDNSYNYATENFSSGKTIDQYKHFFNTIDVIYKKEKK